MPRPPIPSWFFVFVVVRLGRRFLLIREVKDGQTWYLPAGRVEPGESLVAAARRETLEEGGVDVVIEGLLRLDYTARSDGSARQRAVFLARPADDATPKAQADGESLGAGWYTLDEARALPLRGREILDFLEQVEAGGPVLPAACLAERP